MFVSPLQDGGETKRSPFRHRHGEEAVWFLVPNHVDQHRRVRHSGSESKSA